MPSIPDAGLHLSVYRMWVQQPGSRELIFYFFTLLVVLRCVPNLLSRGTDSAVPFPPRLPERHIRLETRVYAPITRTFSFCKASIILAPRSYTVSISVVQSVTRPVLSPPPTGVSTCVSGTVRHHWAAALVVIVVVVAVGFLMVVVVVFTRESFQPRVDAWHPWPQDVQPRKETRIKIVCSSSRFQNQFPWVMRLPHLTLT